MEIQSEVTKALENDEFEVHYQPVINLDTNDTMEYEAFVRWNHPEKGLLYPDDFIDVAIDTGQIINIGKIVLEDACKQLKKWSEEKITAPLISINFSKRQFYDNDLIDTIKALLEKYEIPGTMLEIEVKESTISDDIERAKIVTDNLCDLGVRIIIDNFGSNCSTI